MLRNAFKMKLLKGYAAEYKKRHDQIWPDLKQELQKAGILDYSIYLDEETMTLFAFQKINEYNTIDKLSETAIMQKWWAFMADLMETNTDNSPIVIQLKEVFHMDSALKNKK